MDKFLKAGDVAPGFCLPNQHGDNVCLSNYRGKWLVLYFYARDNTPGCSMEALDFTSNIEAFAALDADVVGISKDSPRSHQSFIEKQGLKITLLSDQEHKVLDAYGVWQMKKLYGKEHLGVVRSTFIIDPEGNIAQVWRNVKVKGHVEAVKEKLSKLKNA